MGFDDVVWDNKTWEKLMKICRDNVSYTYHYHITQDNIAEEENEPNYNSYSYAFHLLHGHHKVMLLGVSPHGPSEEMKEHIKKRARKDALECIIEGHNNFWSGLDVMKSQEVLNRFKNILLGLNDIRTQEPPWSPVECDSDSDADP